MNQSLKFYFAKILLLLVAFSGPISAISISQEELSLIKFSPESISSLYNSKGAELLAEMGGNPHSIYDDELYIILCCIVAHKIAPMGFTTTTDLDKMLNDDLLNDGNYGYLALRIAQSGRPNILNRVVIHFVGWEGGKFGNHQTLFMHCNQSANIFLDVSMGLLVFSSYDQIASGGRIDPQEIMDFCSWKGTEPFKDNVKQGLINGDCKPSDLLYYFSTAEGYMHQCTDINGNMINPDTTFWMTPAGQKRVFR